MVSEVVTVRYRRGEETETDAVMVEDAGEDQVGQLGRGGRGEGPLEKAGDGRSVKWEQMCTTGR